VLALGFCVGAIIYSSYSTAQDNRDQLILERDRLINQMQILRDRWKISALRSGVVQGGVLVRGFVAAKVGGKSELCGNSPPMEDIYVPNIEIVLRSLTTGADSAVAAIALKLP
jgi:hypothetical protein